MFQEMHVRNWRIKTSKYIIYYDNFKQIGDKKQNKLK